ncbi:XRE family transcriptional regulator [Aliivibrio fischeri]
MKTIGAKIEYLRQKNNLTKEALAKIVGVSAGAVSKWELEVSKPKAKSSIQLAEYFMVTLDSLTDPMKELKSKQKMVNIPFYRHVEAAAGNGVEAFDESYEDLCIHACFIPNPSTTIAIKVSGDSMEPIFVDGSVIFIDKSCCNVVDGYVYVFVHDGMVRMKELERIPSGLRLKSYNEKYQQEEIDAEYQSIIIIGRVVGQIQMY